MREDTWILWQNVVCVETEENMELLPCMAGDKKCEPSQLRACVCLYTYKGTFSFPGWAGSGDHWPVLSRHLTQCEDYSPSLLSLFISFLHLHRLLPSNNAHHCKGSCPRALRRGIVMKKGRRVEDDADVTTFYTYCQQVWQGLPHLKAPVGQSLS